MPFKVQTYHAILITSVLDRIKRVRSLHLSIANARFGVKYFLAPIYISVLFSSVGFFIVHFLPHLSLLSLLSSI